MRGATAKEPEVFRLPKKNSKEELITSAGVENDVANRLLEEEENDDFEPVERAALPLFHFSGLSLAYVRSSPNNEIAGMFAFQKTE